MNVGFGCVAEDEEADRDAECTDETWRQSLLRLNIAILIELRLHVLVDVEEVRWDGDDRTDEDAHVSKTFETEGEAVDVDEDEDEGLEPDVEQAVDEGDVKVEEEDHGLGEVESEWPDQRHQCDILACHVLGHELGFAGDAVIASSLAQALRTAYEDVVRAGLGEEEEEKHQAEAREPHQLPDWPSPRRGEATLDRCTLYRKPTNKRTHDRAANSRNTPDRNGICPLDGAPDISQRCTTSSKNRRSKEPSQEPERQQHAKVVRSSRGSLESDEDGESADVNIISADLGDLAHRTPEHRPEAVPSDEQTQAERGSDLANTKDLHDAFNSAGVDGGADVDGECEYADLKGDEALLRQTPVLRVLCDKVSNGTI